jgi:hypothetical protein
MYAIKEPLRKNEPTAQAIESVATIRHNSR